MEEGRLKPEFEQSSHRVNRGTTWYNGPQGARAPGRGFDVTAVRSKSLSIRLARNINHEGEQHEKEG